MRNFYSIVLLIFSVVLGTSFSSKVNNNQKVEIVEVCYTDTVTVYVEQKIEGILATIPHGNPVKEADVHKITSFFGMRIHPILQIAKFHTGLDISAPIGTPVISTSYGKVKFAGRKGNYGNCVIVESGDYSVYYAHLDLISVNKDQFLNKGDLVGQVGTTGLSTGPHLHYEIRFKNKPLDPKNYKINYQ